MGVASEFPPLMAGPHLSCVLGDSKSTPGATKARLNDPSARTPSLAIISASLSTEFTATAPFRIAGTSITIADSPAGFDVPATMTTPSRTASATTASQDGRSEEHTSELQSRG